MNQINLTLELNPENADLIGKILNAIPGAKPAGLPGVAGGGRLLSKPAVEIESQIQFTDEELETPKDPPAEEVKKNPPKKTKPAPKPEEPAGTPETPPISKTDIRDLALKLSKAGKQSVLKNIFSKYGAEKLSDIDEANYPELMADLEAAE